LEGYIVTPSGREILARFAAALRSQSPTRAWSLTGPYGSGKSAFALFAAEALGGTGPSGEWARKLVKENDQHLWNDLFQRKGSLGSSDYLYPVLIAGARSPLETAIADQTLRGLRQRFPKLPPSLAKQFERLSRTTQQTNPTSALVSAFDDVLDFVCHRKPVYQGLLLIIDELGKFLEHAANHPEEGDVFVLQALAEAASRSERPFFLVTILHQAVDRYTAQISPSRRHEWAKVQGRFEDIAFDEPNEQMLRLMSQAIERHPKDPFGKILEQRGRDVATEMWACGARVGVLSRREFIDLVSSCAPLHPTVSLILGPLFRRLAQNERSLFAFLTSGEPFGFQEFLREYTWSKSGGEFYRLDRVYDYVTTALGGALYSQHRGKYWAEVQSVIERLHEASPVELQVAKAIGLIQALGYSAGVPASRDILRFAFAGSPTAARKDVDLALKGLVNRSVAVFRRHAGSYALWEGSDVNIEERLEEARRAVDPNTTLTTYLAELAPPRPLVARRHSHRSGTLRYFEVSYADRQGLMSQLGKGFGEADGRVIYCLPLHPEDRVAMEQTLVDPSLKQQPRLIAALPRELFDLKETCQEVACLRWVMQNTPELSSDATARREIRGRLGAAETALRDEIRRVFVAREGENQHCRWFHSGAEIPVRSPRALNEFLSAACDNVYSATPSLRNELINRRSLSSSAAAARRNLVQAMIEHTAKEALGIEGAPAERSMYESILRAPGLHRLKAGRWGFYGPTAKADLALKTVWKAVERFFTDSAERRKSVTELFGLLSAPPFGLKEGILPVLFSTALLHYDTEAALYEEGTFVPVLTISVLERVMHAPERFEVQFCRISGPRSMVFSRYAAMLSRPEETQDVSKPRLLTVVRPLVRFVRQLPDYVGNTQQLSDSARAIFKSIREAREPDQLLFVDLPRACDTEPFSASGTPDRRHIDTFFGKLRLALAELQQAYPKLQALIEQMLLKVFNLSGPVAQAREELIHRARLVSELSVEIKLKSFLVRVQDTTADDVAWLESLAALLGGKPPQAWNDEDRARYEANLSLMARTFRHFESLAFEMERAGVALLDGDDQAIRVAVTVPRSEELERVVRIPARLAAKAGQAQNKVRRVLKESGVLKDAELSAAILAQMVRQLLRD
jgi:hypothetical protein